MTTLLEYYGLVFDTGEEFENRIAAACMVAAINVLNEATDTALHVERVAWAKRALADARQMARLVRPYVAANAAIAAAGGNGASDNDIQFVVNGAVNYFV